MNNRLGTLFPGCALGRRQDLGEKMAVGSDVSY